MRESTNIKILFFILHATVQILLRHFTWAPLHAPPRCIDSFSSTMKGRGHRPTPCDLFSTPMGNHEMLQCFLKSSFFKKTSPITESSKCFIRIMNTNYSNKHCCLFNFEALRCAAYWRIALRSGQYLLQSKENTHTKFQNSCCFFPNNIKKLSLRYVVVYVMELQGLKQGPKVSNNWEDLLSFSLENTKKLPAKEILFSRTFKTQLISFYMF